MRFGELFKQSRISLGLTLREFCRRNNLDPGNISKLERGLIVPPQKKDSIEHLAKSLNIQTGTREWNTFFDIAATETGRIPTRILDNEEIVKKLPIVFRRLRGQGGFQRTWSSGLDLEAWADYLDIRSTLPQLIRRLIHATVDRDSIVRIEFPAGEGVQRTGWDGFVETTSGNAFVPSGISFFEIGAGKDPKSKAETDFKKRIKSSYDMDTSQMHFIFVTPRKWEKKAEWNNEKNKLGIWKEVRVYDSANLEEWLELAPAVDAWLAGLLGRRPAGVANIDEHWANLSSLTKPRLMPEVFLVSRENEVKILKDWLRGPPSSLAFEGRSPIEVIDFVSAYIAHLNRSQSDEIEARILIVEEKDAWSALSTSINGLILIPHPNFLIEAEIIAEAVRHGHHVLLCLHHIPYERTAKHTLPRVYRYDLEKALVTSGFKEEEASRLARESGGSLTVLKRLKSSFISKKQPEWSLKNEASALAPIILVGGWNDASEADRSIIKKLTGHSYEKVSSDISRWLTSEDPPLIRSHTHWNLISREDSWILLASYLTRDQLDKFEKIAHEILSEDDPKYELPPDEQWCASLYKKIPKFSYKLKKCVAETLALLGAKSNVEIVSDSIGPQNRADRIVRRLFSNSISWQRWASLSDCLPLLAEASPEAFLDSVEKDIFLKEPKIKNLFNKEDASIFSSSPHTGLLWALETLAWEPSLLIRTSLILARLVQIDPGGKLANRPKNSLIEIFLPWFPQTTASVGERIRIIKTLVKRFPDIAWSVLLNLLPKLYGSTTPTHRPSWRNWTMNWSSRVNNSDYWQQVQSYGEILIENAGDNVDRWIQLIEVIEQLPKAAHDRFINFMNEYDIDKMNADAKRKITETLRNKVNQHRYYSDSKWAFSAGIIEKIENIQKRFEPPDLIARYNWLFVPYPRFAGESSEDPILKREKIVYKQRLKALKEIIKEGGIKKVLKLANLAESPSTVGFVLGKSNILKDDNEVLPTLLDSKNEKLSKFSSGFVSGRFSNEEWEWIKQLKLHNWEAKQAGSIALVLPFVRKTWKLVNKLGKEVTEFYWRRISGFCLDPKKGDVEYAVAMLLKHNRFLQAVDVIGMALHDKCELESSLLLEALEVGLKLKTKDDNQEKNIITHIHYEIQELFKKLQPDPNVDKKRLAFLEWGYLGLLNGHGASPKALHGWLQDDPKFFADILSLIYRSRKEDTKTKDPPSEANKRRAESAYRLLRSWKTVPGTLKQGTVDAQKLLNWVTDTRKLCEQSGRLEVCDITIGEVLAYAPSESDGSWPCIAVREVIENTDSDKLINGFEIGVSNKRGIFSKSLTEGGEQEREFAKQYTSYAKECEIECPRTGAALRRIARNYERDAQREDEEVKGRF